MEDISFIQAIINGGPAVIIAIGLIVIWKTWRSDNREHKEEVDALRNFIDELHEKRVDDAIEWSNKYNEAASKTRESIKSVDEYMKVVDRMLSQGGRDVS